MLLLTYRRRGSCRFLEHLETVPVPQPESQTISKTLYRIYCHYFNNDKECPFEEIGCKFKHNISPPCKSEGCNNLLCQYRHSYSSVSFMQKTDVFDKENSFFTSTPKRQRLQSEKCDEKSQCEECYVDRYIQKFQEDNMISPKEILMPHLLAT